MSKVPVRCVRPFWYRGDVISPGSVVSMPPLEAAQVAGTLRGELVDPRRDAEVIEDARLRADAEACPRRIGVRM